VYGQPEFIRDYINYETTDFGPLLYDTETPPYLVEYKGIEVSTISNVFFTQTHVVITAENGDVYSVLPEQVKDGKYFYYQEREVSEKDLLDIKNVKDYAHNYIVKKNGDTLFWSADVKREGYWDSFYIGEEIQFKKINKIVTTGKTSFALKKNGKLYGWGENISHVLSSSKVKKYRINKKVLISDNVKDMSVVGRGVFCLKKNGDLYFRGSNSGNVLLKYNLNP